MILLWLRAMIHPTWHFTVACIGVVCGVVLARWLPGASGLVWLFVAGILTILWLLRPRRVMLLAALIAGLCLGLWRGSIDQSQLRLYTQLYGKHVRMAGRVMDDVDTNNRGQLVVKMGNVTLDNRPLQGELWVTVRPTGKVNLRRSDRIVVDGKLTPGFGNYSGSLNDAALIGAKREEPGDVALVLRDGFADHVRKAIAEPAASLGVGYLLGQKSALPAALVEALAVVGLTHIVVASGYNLTILVRLARRGLARTSKYLAAFAAMAMVGGFIAITGASPSMVRAGLVSALSMWAWYYGRTFHPVTLLVFVAAITVMINPSYAWGDLGWRLSFAAFAGVMIVAPLLQAYFYGNDKPPLIPQIIGETVSAQLATAPIILAAFGQFSNIAILSNLLILPFIPLAMLLTFIAGVGSYVLPSFAHGFGWPAERLLDAMIWVIQWCAEATWAQSKLEFPVWAVLLWYAALAGVCLYLKWRTKYRLYEASIVE